MARIRTIKPEFWEDDVVGSLCRDARLLFIASWNLADDEGLLRWSGSYLKALVFMYDDDINPDKVEQLMREVEAAGLVFSYKAGKAKQPFAYVVNFRKHQKINRPTPGRLPPPPINNFEVKTMYAERDGWICHLCGGLIDKRGPHSIEDFELSLDHVNPVSHGGADLPSNIKAAHRTCNKGRGDRSVESYRELIRAGKTSAQFRYGDKFTDRITDSLSEGSPQERKGREGKGKERMGSHARARDPVVDITDQPPDKNEIFEEIFSDERFVAELARTHPKKNLQRAWEECWLYHSQTPSPPEHAWQWRQKLSTWLINTNDAKNGSFKTKQQRNTDDLIAGFAAEYGSDAPAG